MPGRYSYKPVTTKNWEDLVKLFESKGGPDYCWCMPWRNMNEGGDRSNSSDKKASLKRYLSKNIPIGLLC